LRKRAECNAVNSAHRVPPTKVPLEEDRMDKPFGVLVIVMAMFVTIGALATGSVAPGRSQSAAQRGPSAQPTSAAKQHSTESAQQPTAGRSANATNAEIERGKYLVEEVAKCTECHTPRNDKGELRQEAWLSGSPIWIRPVAPIQNWADHAPALAGWPSFTEEQGERVLEKGTGPQGEELRPPMHIYHMKHEDAKAIIAYLKSIPRSSQSY
jgi:mono/diheme cytochrome c family protein